MPSETASTGTTTAQNFGDRPGSGVGEITGTVYHDANENKILDTGELGIQNVVIALHTGEKDTTDAQGQYYFQVPVGTYTVVETDSTGWASTTPNAVEVILAVDGQKFDREGLVRVGHVSEVSAVFTDRTPPAIVVRALRERKIPLHIA